MLWYVCTSGNPVRISGVLLWFTFAKHVSQMRTEFRACIFRIVLGVRMVLEGIVTEVVLRALRAWVTYPLDTWRHPRDNVFRCQR